MYKVFLSVVAKRIDQLGNMRCNWQPLGRLGQTMPELPAVFQTHYSQFIARVSNTGKLIATTRLALSQLGATETDPFATLGRESLTYLFSPSTRWSEHGRFLLQETGQGYPFLYGMATIAVWAELELFVKDLLILCLEHFPDWAGPEARKVKLSVLDFEALTADERRRQIIEAVENELRSKYKSGIERHETLLAVFGLGGL